jgi:multiple antibiotic resistance protein
MKEVTVDFYLNVLTVFLTLFAVIDMPGNVPLVIRLRKENGKIDSAKSTVIATVIMISILFAGQTLFSLLGIETFHFALAGAMLILYFGVRMVLGIESSGEPDPVPATIFPIAFPIIAGPGTLSTIMSLTQDMPNSVIVSGIVLNALVIYIFLKSADWIQEKLGVVGITIIERIFGILLIAIGMKMLINSLVLSIDFATKAMM